jgi:hypothetical protein
MKNTYKYIFKKKKKKKKGGWGGGVEEEGRVEVESRRGSGF